MPRSEAAPIACTLASGDFDNRLTWIAELARDALREHRRDDLVLQLTYARPKQPIVYANWSAASGHAVRSSPSIFARSRLPCGSSLRRLKMPEPPPTRCSSNL
jgi:hypothetical protein